MLLNFTVMHLMDNTYLLKKKKKKKNSGTYMFQSLKLPHEFQIWSTLPPFGIDFLKEKSIENKLRKNRGQKS